MSQPASAQPQHDSILWALPFTQLEWALTPPAVQNYLKSQHRQIAQLQTQMAQFQSQIEQLQQQVEPLQGRVVKTAQTSSKPPSSDYRSTSPNANAKHPPAHAADKKAIVAMGQPY